MNDILCEISSIYECFSAEAGKNLNGNKSAGTRARVASIELEKALKEFRKKSLEADRN